jgi:type II secretory pathway component HofQ
MRVFLLCAFLLVGCGDPPPDEQPETVSMDVRDKDVGRLLELIGERTVGNVVVDPGVSGTVTITLRKAPWKAAVKAIADRSELKVEAIGDNTLRVYKPRKR